MNYNKGYSRIVSPGEMGSRERKQDDRQNSLHNNPSSHYTGLSRSTFRVTNSPNVQIALKNLMAFSSADISPDVKYVILDGSYIFNAFPTNELESGLIGPTRTHRMWAMLSVNQEVRIQPFDPFRDGKDVYLSKIDIEVSFFSKNQEVKDAFNVDELAETVTKSFSSQIFCVGQLFVFDFHGINIKGVVKSVDVVRLDEIADVENTTEHKGGKDFGIMLPQTQIYFFKAGDSGIQLKGSKKSRPVNRIIQPDFKFEDMGIGGLDNEFSNIFRRAFASRIFPPDLIEKLGINHVKGILLHGPPGTGKTLMARQIGKMLNAVEPIIVNGPEILNKYVGQSEENVRKLFGPAEAEYKEKGDDSQLHIIIFDELDAICKQRGARSDSTGVGDSVVNQLLSKIDGVDQLNNILLIGMTNRKDLIDEALIRPGRLEVQIEVGLPDEKGRLQILNIHTSKMRESNILHSDVNLNELAVLTRNFSGAEIAGLIKSASSFAFNRHIKVGTLAGVQADISKLELTRDDFLGALDEVKPAFGTSEEELSRCVQNHIIPYSPIVSKLLDDGKLYADQVKNSEQSSLVSVLLYGEPGSGKTALAATLAMRSEFPFCKLISPESMVGFSESSKITELSRIFSDSYKSPISVIVVDNIERLIEWVPIGPRFSNAILQTLLVLLRKQPPKNHRLLVLATCNQKSVISDLGFSDAFDAEMYIPQISSWESVEYVLNYFNLFEEKVGHEIINSLKQAESQYHGSTSLIPGGGYEKESSRLKISIKKLLLLMETARQDADTKERFISLISDFF
ncbi:hypothetical protein BB559_006171 [Furculomyces boomerangus]|uniref:Vesicular-fusion protein SEC18 n=2 Tax=Harpellales TaxID=61421 RepID=A0A2T9Y466_9FUNG|nr:hypothetical protein BB559_006171 [Furculomyces boomerangus]PWA03215.1 hypothetical protein BB558_000625 [Smittium angustum]